MSDLKVGLLPLYIELYDQAWPELRGRVDGFYGMIAEALRKRGVQVVSNAVCRVRPEFEAALKSFEDAGVDAIVTLHLAYSPSLESAQLLAGSSLPLIVLDTTPTYAFGASQKPVELLYNHGIHGVQDFCSLLLRYEKRFEIEAGHWERSDVLDRVIGRVRSCRLATAIRRSRVGLIGQPFRGMGDFAVPLQTLKATTGIETIQADVASLAAFVKGISQQEIEAEIRSDHEVFQIGQVDPGTHANTAKTSLAVRRWMEHNRLSAFTFNFLAIDQQCGLPTVPFLEACKAMARGQGYAGEGDVLTAALVGSLASVYPDTSFIEMFCPDWENDAVFLSHMGEMNHRVAAGGARLQVKDFPFTDTCPPMALTGRFRGGAAVLVDLAPQAAETYALIVAPVTMLDVPEGDSFSDSVRGWFRHTSQVSDFLAEYSRNGGTHHLALVYGDVSQEISGWGRMMGWKTVDL